MEAELTLSKKNSKLYTFSKFISKGLSIIGNLGSVGRLAYVGYLVGATVVTGGAILIPLGITAASFGVTLGIHKGFKIL